MSFKIQILIFSTMLITLAGCDWCGCCKQKQCPSKQTTVEKKEVTPEAEPKQETPQQNIQTQPETLKMAMPPIAPKMNTASPISKSTAQTTATPIVPPMPQEPKTV